MKVAVLSTPSWRTPPLHYGPWEFFASTLAEGLYKKGIEVTLFATQDSETKTTLDAVVPKGIEEDKFYGKGDLAREAQIWLDLHVANCMQKAKNFDIIHNNVNFTPLFYTPLIETPVVTTVHSGLIEFNSSPLILSLFKKYNALNHYVSISNAARHKELEYIKTIYHGINLSDYEFESEKGKYLLVFGRLDHDKGVVEAIDVAKKFGMKLVLAGITPNEEYFNEKIMPHIDGLEVEYIGSVGGEKKSEVLKGAYALMHLINFEEPFGISVVEAMACGTPVVALKKGSMMEVINHSKTGFVVENMDEALTALSKVEALKRKDCRDWVAENFTTEKMIENYISLYEKILSQKK